MRRLATQAAIQHSSVSENDSVRKSKGYTGPELIIKITIKENIIYLLLTIRTTAARREPGFWNSLINRKMFLQQIGQTLGVKEVS